MFIKECKRRSARKPGFEGLVATNGDGKGAEIIKSNRHGALRRGGLYNVYVKTQFMGFIFNM